MARALAESPNSMGSPVNNLKTEPSINGKAPKDGTDADVREAVGEAGCLPDQSYGRAPEFVVTVSCGTTQYEVVRLVGAAPLSAEQRAARTKTVAFAEAPGVRLEVRPKFGASVEQARSLLILVLGADSLPPGSPSPSL
jgi:hypothetical protein